MKDIDSVLEPSAGIGSLLDYLPLRTKAIEISSLRCEVIKAKGFDVECYDFIEWSKQTKDRYDKIIMNPPFDQGQWNAHIKQAASLVNPNGKLIAILPTSAKNKLELDGFEIKWHGPYDNQFSGTSIAVIILEATLH
jgi:Methyltransferase small domain